MFTNNFWPGGQLRRDFKGRTNEREAGALVLWGYAGFFLELGAASLQPSYGPLASGREAGGAISVHTDTYGYSEMVTRYRGPFIPLPKLNQLTQVTPSFLR